MLFRSPTSVAGAESLLAGLKIPRAPLDVHAETSKSCKFRASRNTTLAVSSHRPSQAARRCVDSLDMPSSPSGAGKLKCRNGSPRIRACGDLVRCAADRADPTRLNRARDARSADSRSANASVSSTHRTPVPPTTKTCLTPPLTASGTPAAPCAPRPRPSPLAPHSSPPSPATAASGPSPTRPSSTPRCSRSTSYSTP